MTDAEVTAYLAGREVASLDAQSVSSAVAALQFDILANRVDLRAARDKLGTEKFREWMFRGSWDRLGEPDALC